jgi:hypothetical protein
MVYDPGHAWIKVPIAELKELGILTQISTFSYISGDFLWLEEDCDLPQWLNTKIQKENIIDLGDFWGKNIQIKHTNRMSRIRSFRRFNTNGE